MSDWVASFILEYDDPRHFTRIGSKITPLFSEWLNEQFGMRDPTYMSRNSWNMFTTHHGEPWGVKVVFKRKSDAMLFKLTWL